MAKNFQEVNNRHKVTNPGSSEDSKQGYTTTKRSLDMLYSNCRKPKIEKKKILRIVKKEYLIYKRKKIRIKVILS